MVEEAAALGDLLKLPKLENETIVLINAKMRDLIGELKPTTPEEKREINSLLSEWMNGQKEGE